MNFLKRNIIFIGASIIAAVLLLIVIIISLSKADNTNGSKTEPFPTPLQNSGATPSDKGLTLPDSSEEYEKTFKESVEKESPQVRRDATVGSLIPKLPYSGKSFTLTYSFDQNIFTVTFDNKDRESGSEEFDQFLKQNNVQDRNWIRNLSVTYR